jgi:phage/plasmid-like protein (TIGR03299 family)
MAYVGEVPWHGLGNRVEDLVTAEEMAVAAGIDWQVSKKPMFFLGDDDDVHQVGSKHALVRSNDQKVLSVVGENWAPVQNSEMLAFMREFAGAGGATLETAGSLRGGKVVWGMARLAREFEVKKGDRVRGYVLFSSPHEAGRASTIRTTSVRVVCMNTMMAAMREGTVEYRQSHSRDFDYKAAQKAIADANDAIGEFEKRAHILSDFNIGLEDAITKVLMPVFFPDDIEDLELMATIANDTESQPKVLQQIINSMTNAPGADLGTGWGVLNGVTHWADHVAGNSADTRLTRSWSGDLLARKAEVEQKLLELAQ